MGDNVSELAAQLNPETTELSISTHPPTAPPPSGSLVLNDRSVTPNYRHDGYQWVRRRNSNAVQEDHVKRRVRSRFCVTGCYLDTELASQSTDSEVDVLKSMYRFFVEEGEDAERASHRPSPSTCFDDDMLEILCGPVFEEDGGGAGAMTGNSNLGGMSENTAAIVDTSDLDFLEQIFAEEERDILETDLSLESDTDSNFEELAAILAANAEVEQQPARQDQPTPLNLPPTVIPTPTIAPVDAKNDYHLAEIVNIIPKKSAANLEIDLFCSGHLPKDPTEDEKVFIWYTLAAFVYSSIDHQKSADLEIRALHLSPLSRVAPTSYCCTVPPDAKTSVGQRIVIVSARLYLGADPACAGVRAGVEVCLQQAWRNALANEQHFSESSRLVLSLKGERPSLNIRILTQLTNDLFVS